MGEECSACVKLTMEGCEYLITGAKKKNISGRKQGATSITFMMGWSLTQLNKFFCLEGQKTVGTP